MNDKTHDCDALKRPDERKECPAVENGAYKLNLFGTSVGPHRDHGKWVDPVPQKVAMADA
jgi:hypothetical protein